MFYSKYTRKSNGTGFASGAEMIALPLNDVIVKDTGDEFFKSANNSFSKVVRVIPSKSENDLVYGGVTFNNSWTGTNVFVGANAFNSVLTSVGVIPAVTAVSDLGNVTKKWRNLYLSNEVSADSANITGAVTSGNLLPITVNTHDVGLSSSKWRNLHLSGSVNANTINSVTGTFTGSVSVSGNLTATGTITSGSIVPNSTIVDIGSNGSSWRNLYLSGTITTIGNITSGNVLPSSTVVDLGSTSSSWRDLHLSGTVNAPSVIVGTITSGNVLPNSTVADIGSIGSRWRDLHLSGSVNTNNINIGFGGTGVSLAHYNDSTTGIDKKLGWDSTVNAWVADDATGTAKEVVHAGNISNFVSKALPQVLTQIPMKRDGDAIALSGLSKFTNASTVRTYVDPFTWQVTSAGVDEPRYERSPDGTISLLLENASTNLVLDSGAIGSASWSANPTNVPTVVLNNVIAPDGTNTGSTITGAVTPAYTYYTGFGAAANGEAFTVSAWIKPLIGETINLSSNLNSTSITGDGKWHRVVSSSIGNGVSDKQMLFFTTIPSQTFDVWGAQLEALTFASSYIPTTTGPVQRLADNLTIPARGNLPLASSPHTHVFDISFKGCDSVFYNDFMSTYVYNGVNSYNMFRFDLSNNVQLFHGSSATPGSKVINLNQTYRIVKVVDALGKHMYVDGVLVGSQPGFLTTNPSVNLTVSGFNGHISNLRTFDVALNANEVSAL